MLARATCAAIAIAIATASLTTPAAVAAPNQVSIMQDDDHLLYAGDKTRDATLRRMKTLGADFVRVTVLWSVVADGLDKKPAHPSDPNAYPKANWDKFDRLDRGCRTVGLICYYDITGPGPSWSHPKPPARYAKDAKQWKPSPRDFYSFVQAVGKRYGGTYKDENDRHYQLPAIRVWSLWNEPNQGGWLRPQFLNGKPVSPSLYRDLYSYGLRALISTGHDPRSADAVFAGETAPLDSGRQTTSSGMGPKKFLNELLCGPGSGGLGCSSFAKTGPIVTTAWAHHPYTKMLAPQQPPPRPDDITMANLNDLPTQLDQLAAQTNHIRTGLPIISSEFGYETNPPDPTAPVNLQQQSQYLMQGDYITEQNPRVLGNTQFLLYDAKPDHHAKAGSAAFWSTYQSGLFGSTGVAKPAAQSYTLPFLVFPQPLPAPDPNVPPEQQPPPNARLIKVWGQLRYAADIPPGSSDQITLEYSADNGVHWAPITPISVTNPKAFFEASALLPGPGLVRVTVGAQDEIHSISQPVP